MDPPVEWFIQMNNKPCISPDCDDLELCLPVWNNLVPNLWLESINSFVLGILVSYLTMVSDLDLAFPTDQFMASPPVRYINPGCCVKKFQKSNVANSVFCIIFVVDPLVKGGCKQLKKYTSNLTIQVNSQYRSLNLTMLTIFVCWKILVCPMKVSWGGWNLIEGGGVCKKLNN